MRAECLVVAFAKRYPAATAATAASRWRRGLRTAGNRARILEEGIVAHQAVMQSRVMRTEGLVVALAKRRATAPPVGTSVAAPSTGP